jgi:hypothetical protein
MRIYEAPDGFRGTHDEVLAHEKALEMKNGNGFAEGQVHSEDDRVVMHIYEAPDGFRGTYEEVEAYEKTLGDGTVVKGSQSSAHDLVLMRVYEAPDGFRGTYEEVEAHEKALGMKNGNDSEHPEDDHVLVRVYEAPDGFRGTYQQVDAYEKKLGLTTTTTISKPADGEYSLYEASDGFCGTYEEVLTHETRFDLPSGGSNGPSSRTALLKLMNLLSSLDIKGESKRVQVAHRLQAVLKVDDVAQWLQHRNEASATQALTQKQCGLLPGQVCQLWRSAQDDVGVSLSPGLVELLVTHGLAQFQAPLAAAGITCTASLRKAAAATPISGTGKGSGILTQPPVSANPAQLLKLQACAAASRESGPEQAMAWPTLEALFNDVLLGKVSGGGGGGSGDSAAVGSDVARWCASLRARNVRTVSELRTCSKAYLEQVLKATPTQLNQLWQAFEAESARNRGTRNNVKGFAVYEVRVPAFKSS